MFRIHADPETNRYNPCGPVKDKNSFRETFNAWLAHHHNHHFGYYTLEEKATNDIFGVCGFRVGELNHFPVLNTYYRISPLKTRRGYVKEAAKAILQSGVLDQVSHYPIIVQTLAANLPSRRTAESLGLVHDPSYDDYQGKGNVYYFKPESGK